MGSLSIWHWVIVLLIVMLVFGTKRLRNVGSDLGGAIKGFKEGMKESQADDKSSDDPLRHLPEGQTIEGEIRERARA